MAIGFILTDLLTVIVTQIAETWQDQGLQTWDEQMLQWIVKHAPLSFAQGITWESPGNLIGMLPVVTAFMTIAAWLSRPLIAATVAVGYVLQFAFAWTGWLLWNRDRPDLVAGGIAAPGLHSFPSGHALVMCTVYGFMAFLWWRSSRHPVEKGVAIAVFVGWIGMVNIARLVLGTHWLTDMLAGNLLGFAWLTTLIVALRQAETADN